MRPRDDARQGARAAQLSSRDNLILVSG